MTDFPTRRSVRAIIVEGDHILLLRREKHAAPYWAVPGGGVEEGEDNQTAVRRECKEELGVAVGVGERLFTHRMRYPDCFREQHYYICHITGGTVGTGTGPEYQPGTHYRGTHTPEWIPIDRLVPLPLWPQRVKKKILAAYHARRKSAQYKESGR